MVLEIHEFCSYNIYFYIYVHIFSVYVYSVNSPAFNSTYQHWDVTVYFTHLKYIYFFTISKASIENNNNFLILIFI